MSDDTFSRGSFTLPGEAGYEKLTKKLMSYGKGVIPVLLDYWQNEDKSDDYTQYYANLAIQQVCPIQAAVATKNVK